MTEKVGIDFINDPDPKVRDLSYSRSRDRQLLDLLKGSTIDMGFGPREDEELSSGDLDSDEGWPSDRLETFIKDRPRGPGYVCDVVYHSEQLPVVVYAVLVNRGRGLEVAELELFRRDWGYFEGIGSDEYTPPDTPDQPDSQNPPSLITSDVLRRIPIGDILTRTQTRLTAESWRTEGVHLLAQPGETGRNLAAEDLTEEQRRALENSTAIGARRRGRPELSDELLIEVAQAYIWEAGRGRGALRRMSETFDRPEATIRDWIALARRRGYLAPTKPGRRGAAPGPNLPTNAADTEPAEQEGHFAANLSRERRRDILRMIEGEGVLDADLNENARLLYVVGGLVCNDVGFVRQADLEAAMADPDVLAAAMEILNKAHRRALARNNSGKRPNQRRRR
jgi:hypothetical protein